MIGMFRPPGDCPICDEFVPAGAVACPECGADDRSGWRDGAEYSGDLPDEDFDYDGFVEQEFGGGMKPAGISWIWWVAAALLLLAFLARALS